MRHLHIRSAMDLNRAQHPPLLPTGRRTLHCGWRRAGQGGVKGGDAKDKRNLYLAKEGLITEGSAAWEALSEADK